MLIFPFCQSWWDAQFFLMAATNFQIGESKMIYWRVRAFDELLFSVLSMPNVDSSFDAYFYQSFQMREWPTVWSFWFMESLGSSESPLRFCFSASTELTRGRGKSHFTFTFSRNHRPGFVSLHLQNLPGGAVKVISPSLFHGIAAPVLFLCIYRAYKRAR